MAKPGGSCRWQRQALLDPMGQSFIPSLWGVVGELVLGSWVGGSKRLPVPTTIPG